MDMGTGFNVEKCGVGECMTFRDSGEGTVGGESGLENEDFSHSPLYELLKLFV